MFKILSVIALATICSGAEAAAQVATPAPIRVPIPVNSSPILVNREIGRAAARRAAARRREALRRKKARAAKASASAHSH